jgi:hypothetical protein
MKKYTGIGNAFVFLKITKAKKEEKKERVVLT